MDKMSVWSTLIISFPEEILTVLITLVIAGYKDALNFRDKNKVIKLLLCSTLMVLSTIITMSLFSFSQRLFINSIVFFFLIIIIYKYKPASCLIGFTLSTIAIIGSEAILVPILIGFLNIHINDISKNIILLFLVSLPDRIVQIIILLVAIKVKNITLKVDKLTPIDLTIIAMYFFMLISNSLLIEEKYLTAGVADLIPKIKVIINITVVMGFSLWLVVYLLKLRQNIVFKENMHDIELHHVKQLISEGKTDYAIELIELTLKERGYYNN